METWIFIPFFVMLAPVALVYLVLRYRQQGRQARYQTMLQLADKGVELPIALVAEPETPFCERRRGLVLVAGGVGLMCTVLALPFEFADGRGVGHLWGLGLFPVLTGAGYLASWWLNQRDRRGA